jgi:SSS family solute:Na+ symporter
LSLGLRGYEHGVSGGSLLWIVNNIYFQYWSLLIFVVSAITMIAVSYVTAAPSARRSRA